MDANARHRLHRLVVLLVLIVAPVACRSDSGAGAVWEGIDREELEHFADRFFAREMRRLHIPGLTLVVVQGEQILLAKGYGYADLDQDRPVDADDTVVRIGSISKLFVATAVMQLVEQGQLDLHTDVNRYLDTWQLDDRYPEPVTLVHLLTHTAGFEEPPYQTTLDSTQVPPLGLYLAQHMPPREHPPGETFAYCSHGYALAAYLVEQVSGMSFDQYVAEHILRPLGMAKSGYLLSPPLPGELATGYQYVKRRQVAQPVDYDEDYPSGSMVSTAADMARFMIAHMQQGCYGETCILTPETMVEMHRRQASTAYEGQHVTYGFVETEKDGRRVIGHTGAIRGFGSALDLLPAYEVGYFLSFNQECYQTKACEIIPRFRDQFIERFFVTPPGEAMGTDQALPRMP